MVCRVRRILHRIYRIEAWEADIRYHESYLYDMNLTVGRYYGIDGSRNIVPHSMEIPDRVRSSLKPLLWDKVY